jgi:hypothetical protein
VVNIQQILAPIGLVAVAAALYSTAGTIQTGNVGIRTTLGIISQEEIEPGIYFKWPVISTVHEFSAKDIVIDLSDLTPKAKDNLSLRDMDVSIYYRADQKAVADLFAKYASQSARHADGYYMPAYELVWRIARNACYEEIARLDSLVIHTQRDQPARRLQRSSRRSWTDRPRGVHHLPRGDPLGADRPVHRAVDPAGGGQSEEAGGDAGADRDRQARGRDQGDGGAGDCRVEQDHFGLADAGVSAARGEPGPAEVRREGQPNTVIVPSGMTVTPLVNTGK